MTFDARETSNQAGEPIELYTFTVYGEPYRYTTASEDLLVDLFTYRAAVIRRSRIEESGDIARNDVTIRTPEDFEITQFFDPWPPSDVVLLTIGRAHRGDSEIVPWWSGRVVNCKWEEGEAIFHAENIFTSLRRSGLRRLYGRTCPHMLYDVNSCRAVKASFQVPLTVVDIDGRSIEVSGLSGFPDGRFAGGDIEWERAVGQVERRGIKSHTGAVLELTHPIAGLTAAQTVLGAPGCAHNVDDCDNFFDNMDNYGGWPFFQEKNPMGGNSVF